MKELPKVSVLIPAHNEEVVIRQTLKAMVNLYYPKDRLEIIVVNDNSSDRTGDIVNEFSEKYDFIKMVITKPPNAGKGKSSALNSGFAESNGDVICVYDADNTPEKMAVYYLVLGLMNDEKAGAVVGKFRVINAAKTLLTRFINIERSVFSGWPREADGSGSKSPRSQAPTSRSAEALSKSSEAGMTKRSLRILS